MGHHDTMLLHINTVLILMASFYRVWYKNRAPSHDPSQAWLNVKIWPHSHFSRLFFISVLTWSQQHYTYMCKYSQWAKKFQKSAKSTDDGFQKWLAKVLGSHSILSISFNFSISFIPQQIPIKKICNLYNTCSSLTDTCMCNVCNQFLLYVASCCVWCHECYMCDCKPMLIFNDTPNKKTIR